MFKTRAIVTFTLAPLAIFIIYLGGWVFFIAMTLLLLIGSREFSAILEHHGWHPSPVLIGGGVLLQLIAGHFPAFQLSAPFLLISICAIIIDALWRYERNKNANVTAGMLANLGGVMILGWMGSHLFLLRNLDQHGQWLLLVLSTIWFSDTFAYLVGSQIGRHRLTPRLSPKKSVEGYLAGILLGIGGAALFKFLFLPLIPWPAVFIVSAILTPLVPAGDLCFSLFKRETGVKDSGQIFPGHGGVLDRFDTLLWGGAIAYYLILYLF